MSSNQPPFAIMDAFYSCEALASRGKVQPGRDAMLVACKKRIGEFGLGVPPNTALIKSLNIIKTPRIHSFTMLHNTFETFTACGVSWLSAVTQRWYSTTQEVREIPAGLRMWDECIIKINISATRPWIDGVTHHISHDVSEKEFRLRRNAEQHPLTASCAIKTYPM